MIVILGISLLGMTQQNSNHIRAQAPAETTIEMVDGTVFVGSIIDATTAQIWLRIESGEISVIDRTGIKYIYGIQPKPIKAYSNPERSHLDSRVKIVIVGLGLITLAWVLAMRVIVGAF